jgi:hypothetical protein
MHCQSTYKVPYSTAPLRLACALTPAQAKANEAMFKKVVAAG